MELSERIRIASKLIGDSPALWIGAGAGMGVDSNLPDFRGNEGFWNAYPPYKKLGLSFYDLANPYWFRSNPQQAWGFYGHRLNLYRDTVPHSGFDSLLNWTRRKNGNYFVFTSNVDGHFQKAGFDEDRIVECHGSIHHLQCNSGCSREIWPTPDDPIEIESQTMLAQGDLPGCPNCGGMTRPNVLMFGDFDWIDHRTASQEGRYAEWLHSIDQRLVKLEFGAGTAVPTVRYEAQKLPGRLIRINTRESETSGDGISIDCGALEFIEQVSQLLF